MLCNNIITKNINNSRHLILQVCDFNNFICLFVSFRYTKVHIWACPPGEGDDYIFYRHPPEQKIPKAQRLQEWYNKMLDKGIIDGTVVDYKVIFK